MSKSYVFTGRILPEREATGIRFENCVTVKEETSGQTFEVKLSIIKSQISAAVTTEITDILTLRNLVDHVIRMAVDSINYVRGWSLDVEIASVSDQNGFHLVFDVAIAKFGGNENGIDADFRRLYALVADSPYLRLALSNLRDAMRKPSDTGFHSYRTIECVRQAFRESYDKEETENERKGNWKRMNDALQIQEEFSKYLTEYANPQRHGGYKAMTEAERIDAMERARKIVDRFCIYLERNKQPLNEMEFPKLVSQPLTFK